MSADVNLDGECAPHRIHQGPERTPTPGILDLSASAWNPANPRPATAARKTRVLVADDHPLFREGLMGLINRQEDLLCCHPAPSGTNLLHTLTQEAPDLVLLDLCLRQGEGLELLCQVKAAFPHLRVLVVSNWEETLYAERALRAGAHGYLMKAEAADEILAAIRRVRDGGLSVSHTVAMSLLRKCLEPGTATRDSRVGDLSVRELQVFGMIGDGLTPRQIAERLTLSVKTIEAHRETIKHKLGLGAAAALVREAVWWRQGQAGPGDTTATAVTAAVNGEAAPQRSGKRSLSRKRP